MLTVLLMRLARPKRKNVSFLLAKLRVREASGFALRFVSRNPMPGGCSEERLGVDEQIDAELALK